MSERTKQDGNPKTTAQKFLLGLLGAGIGLVVGIGLGTALSFHEFPYASRYPLYAIYFGALIGAEPGIIIGFGIGWYIGSKRSKKV